MEEEKVEQETSFEEVEEVVAYEAVAKLRNCPLSPRKMRLIIDLIRNQDVNSAIMTLKYHPKKMYARYIEKLLFSAIANWNNKFGEEIDVEDVTLHILKAQVDGGRQLKRIRPAPQGRAHRIRKRSNHVTIVVGLKEENKKEL